MGKRIDFRAEHYQKYQLYEEKLGAEFVENLVSKKKSRKSPQERFP